MKKLIRGIVDFRKHVRPLVKDRFAQLALGQRPDALFIACSDSRVVPNLFASSDPGDLFVVRNVGNLIPPCGEEGHSHSDESEAAAIEFALLNLPVTSVIICGHSECGAMDAIVKGREKIVPSNLKSWLRHGEGSLRQMESSSIGKHLAKHNQLSQLNVLRQIEHLETYPVVQERLAAGSIKLYGWWFDIKEADVYEFNSSSGQFSLIDEKYVSQLD